MDFGLFSVGDFYPGRHGRSQSAFLAELLQQAELAETLGFHSYWVAEHHFAPYGLLPNPAVFLAAVAARTRIIRVGTAVSVLPLRSPLHAAEDYAMLDVLCGGRLNVGVGSGYLAHEFAPLGIAMEDKVDRFNECVEVLKAAWTGDLLGGFQGRFYQYQPVQLQVQCVQEPHPPLSCAIMRPEAAFYVGLQGMDLMVMPYVTVDDPEGLKVLIERFRRGAAQAGRDNARVVAALPVYVGETEAEAHAIAGMAVERFMENRHFFRTGTYEDLNNSGLAAWGTPDQVAVVIRDWRAAGVDEVIGLFNYGSMPHEQVVVSMERFARLVVPQCR